MIFLWKRCEIGFQYLWKITPVPHLYYTDAKLLTGNGNGSVCLYEQSDCTLLWWNLGLWGISVPNGAQLGQTMRRRATGMTNPRRSISTSVIVESPRLPQLRLNSIPPLSLHQRKASVYPNQFGPQRLLHYRANCREIEWRWWIEGFGVLGFWDSWARFSDKDAAAE